MTPDDRDLMIEALSMAANRKQQLAARLPPDNHHALMERRMRKLRIALIRAREGERHAAAAAGEPPCKERSRLVRGDGGCLRCDADAGEACREKTPEAAAIARRGAA